MKAHRMKTCFIYYPILVCIMVSQSMQAVFPNIQTSMFSGVPDNWYKGFETDPFVKVGEKFYYFEFVTAQNWHDALNQCRRRNANLATIVSEAEMKAIDQYIPADKRHLWFWLSGNDLGKEGTFFWTGTGNPFIYTNWSKGQPDNADANENCVHLWAINGGYEFNDIICGRPLHYICQTNDPKTMSFTVW